MSLGLPERFENKILPEPNSGCWLWTGAIDRKGYARVLVGKINNVAHRVVFTMLKGGIPAGLTLDHLCRVKCCVNPEHMEPVTNRINILRSNNMAARHARKDRCMHGHLPDKFYQTKGGRVCRECNRLRRVKKRGTK